MESKGTRLGLAKSESRGDQSSAIGGDSDEQLAEGPKFDVVVKRGDSKVTAVSITAIKSDYTEALSCESDPENKKRGLQLCKVANS